MMQTVTIQCCQGQDLAAYLPALANLRIEVFKDFPYLYQGDLAYEQTYLQTYLECAKAMMVLALAGTQVVGASTAMPLTFETLACQQPFIDHAMLLSSVFYLGESVLLPAYRGQGVYRRFFSEREAAARAHGCVTTAFCAVERAAKDTRRPTDYQPLDAIWCHFGYVKQAHLRAHYEWQDIGEAHSTAKPLVYWLKTL